MAFFLPSFFQKRILRYALSRLELLETDDLGLDRLDIAWGRRSTVELRDVGVNLEVRPSLCSKKPHSLEAALQANSRLEINCPSETTSEPHLVESPHIATALDDPR